MAANYGTSVYQPVVGVFTRAGYAVSDAPARSGTYTRDGYATAYQVVGFIERPRPVTGLLWPLWWTDE